MRYIKFSYGGTFKKPLLFSNYLILPARGFKMLFSFYRNQFSTKIPRLKADLVFNRLDLTFGML